MERLWNTTGWRAYRFVRRVVSGDGVGACRAGLTLALVAAAAGCAGYSPAGLAPGTTSAEAIRRLGAPTAVHPPTADLPAVARRLEFARGPFGKHTYFVDFDQSDRLLGWEQVLTEPRFDSIRAGMSDRDVRSRIGSPSETRELRRQSQIVWSYRYVNPFCKWFMVGMGPAGQVVDTSYGPDPICEPRGRGGRR